MGAVPTTGAGAEVQDGSSAGVRSMEPAVTAAAEVGARTGDDAEEDVPVVVAAAVAQVVAVTERAAGCA